MRVFYYLWILGIATANPANSAWDSGGQPATENPWSSGGNNGQTPTENPWSSGGNNDQTLTENPWNSGQSSNGNVNSWQEPCDNENICDHLCEPLEKKPFYRCLCSYGYQLNKTTNLCEALCGEGFYWDEIKGCKYQVKECKKNEQLFEYNYATGCIQKYYNYRTIGHGYDLMIADPFQMDTLGADPGQKHQIFEAYKEHLIFDPTGTQLMDQTCLLYGYEANYGAAHTSSETTKTITSQDDLKKIFKEVVTEKDIFETSNVQVLDMANRKSSKDTANVKGIQHSDSKGFEYSKTDTENNVEIGSESTSDESSGSQTQDESTDECKTAGKALSFSETKHTSKTNVDGSVTSNSNEDCDSSGSSDSSGGGGGFSLFGLSLSSSSQASSHVEKRACTTRGTQSERRTENTDGSSSGKDAQFNFSVNKCGKKGLTNSRALRFMTSAQKSVQRDLGTSSGANHKFDLMEMKQSTHTEQSGLQLEQGQQFSYQVKGFKKGFVGSDTFENNQFFLNSSQGSITISQNLYVQYTFTMKNHEKPAFTSDFIKEIEELDLITATFGKFDGKIDTVSQKFNELFIKFIRNYGTHFATRVQMGSKKFSSVKYTAEESQKVAKSTRENCAKVVNNINAKISEIEECKFPSGITENVITQGKSLKKVEQATFGTRKTVDDGDLRTENPVPIRRELEPVTQLFTEKFMGIDRIKNPDQTPINFKAILGWFLPRYEYICLFIDQIHPTKHKLIKSCQNFCKPGQHKCREKVEKCIQDDGQIDGYRCEYIGCKAGDLCASDETCVDKPDRQHSKGFECLPFCPNSGCAKRDLKRYKRGRTTDLCYPKKDCNYFTAMDGSSGSGSECISFHRASYEYCCLNKAPGTKIPHCAEKMGCPTEGCPVNDMSYYKFEMSYTNCRPKDGCEFVKNTRNGMVCQSSPRKTLVPTYCCKFPSPTHDLPLCRM